MTGRRLVVADAEVVHLPTTWTQNCFACKNATFGERGTYCTTFGEVILSESVAGQDCPAFEASDGQAYVRTD